MEITTLRYANVTQSMWNIFVKEGASDDRDGVSQVYGGDGSSQSDPEVLAGASGEAIDGLKGGDAHVKGISMVQKRQAM